MDAKQWINELNDEISGKLIKPKRELENNPIYKQELEKIGLCNFQNNVNSFVTNIKFFYDKKELFWIWKEDEFKWEIIDEISLMNLFDNFHNFQMKSVVAPYKTKYIDLLKAIGRNHEPKEPLVNWIQFKDKIFDIKTKQTFDATPEYSFTNPIPWELGDSDATPEMDKLFSQWVDRKWLSTLYEIIAYCCYRDYPLHIIFCLFGSGMNGKGQYQKLLVKFFGKDNLCSVELDEVQERFGSFGLYKKLICQMGETNFGIMDKTSLLKKLVGNDLIQFEYKNKMPFSDYNYAKIIINTNSLPTSNDTSEGFYRRWIIVPFENSFENKCVLNVIDKIPEQEFKNLAFKIANLLPIILLCGRFSGQGTILQQKDGYVAASNPLPLFIKECCEEGNPETHYVRYSEIYRSYVNYLNKGKKRIVGKQEMRKALEREGFEVRRTMKKLWLENEQKWESDNWIEGLKLKKVM